MPRENKTPEPEIVQSQPLVRLAQTKDMAFESFINRDTSGASYVSFKTKLDTGSMFGLKKSPEVAVADGFLGKDDVFELHSHAESEWIHVYRGCLLVEVGSDLEEVRPQGYAYIPPNHQHRFTAREDTRYIIIAVPAIEGFPDGYGTK